MCEKAIPGDRHSCVCPGFGTCASGACKALLQRLSGMAFTSAVDTCNEELIRPDHTREENSDEAGEDEGSYMHEQEMHDDVPFELVNVEFEHDSELPDCRQREQDICDDVPLESVNIEFKGDSVRPDCGQNEQDIHDDTTLESVNIQSGWSCGAPWVCSVTLEPVNIEFEHNSELPHCKHLV